MPQQGSAGNVIGAVASFFLPGLGQLVQGRPAEAAMWFFASLIAWTGGLALPFLVSDLILPHWVFGLLIGPFIHIYNVYEAAVWEGPGTLPGDTPTHRIERE